MKDFYKLENLIYATTGVKPKIMRFPGGSNNTVSRRYSSKGFMVLLTEEIENRGYEYFDWNVSNGDAAGGRVSKEKLIRNIKNGLGNKTTAILLMHDSWPKTTTAQSLPEILDYLISKGYKFKVLTENSYRINFRIN